MVNYVVVEGWIHKKQSNQPRLRNMEEIIEYGGATQWRIKRAESSKKSSAEEAEINNKLAIIRQNFEERTKGKRH